MDKKWYEQSSTWKGLSMAAGVLGLIVSPEHIAEIGGAVGTLYTLLAVFWSKN
jgi:hypothetical protein